MATKGAFEAEGIFGQMIYVNPTRHVVIVSNERLARSHPRPPVFRSRRPNGIKSPDKSAPTNSDFNSGSIGKSQYCVSPIHLYCGTGAPLARLLILCPSAAVIHRCDTRRSTSALTRFT